MNLRHAALAGLLLSGCHAFDWEEAEVIASSNNQLALVAYDALFDDWTKARRRTTQVTLDWAEVAGGWTFSGLLSSDGPVWTGAMDFDGSLVGDESSAAWTFGIGYDAVHFEDLTLDGDMDWHWAVDVLSTGFTMEFGAQGEITASGEVEGTGEVDYLAMIEVTGTSASFDVDGSIGGAPLDFSLTVNLPTR